MYTTFVGATAMACAVDNRALSREILDAGLASVKGCGLTLSAMMTIVSGPKK
jgi:hypothetical protein